MWGRSTLCRFISAYLLFPEFWIYVYLCAHTFTHKYVTLRNMHFCTHMSALMAQGCVDQDSHLCETAAGLVLRLHWPLCLTLECDGQIEQICTAPALSVSATAVKAAALVEDIAFRCPAGRARPPVGQTPPKLWWEGKTRNCFLALIAHGGKWPLNISSGDRSASGFWISAASDAPIPPAAHHGCW